MPAVSDQLDYLQCPVARQPLAKGRLLSMLWRASEDKPFIKDQHGAILN